MATALQPHEQDVRELARRILHAHRTGHPAAARQELASFKCGVSQLGHFDTLESERLELLEIALESLESPAVDRAQAAGLLLEHLSSGDPLLRRRNLPA